MSHVNLHLVGHHQLKQEGMHFITKDVWLNPFFYTINNKQVSIKDPTIQKRKLQLFHTSFKKLGMPTKISQNGFT
jgi:hypothetical protein